MLPILTSVPFSYGWFVETMPDLNQRNPLLADYLTQNALWWVEYLGLAGIRMDTYPYPDKTYLTEWSRRNARISRLQRCR